MSRADEIEQELKKVNNDLKNVRSAPAAVHLSLGKPEFRLFTILAVIILLAGMLLFTYGKISGMAVFENVTNETFDNLTNNVTIYENITDILPETLPDQITEMPPETIPEPITEQAPQVKVIDSKSIESTYFAEAVPTSVLGEYDVNVNTELESVKKIKLNGVKRKDFIDINLEELPKGNWKQHYAIDLSNLNFTSGELTAVAQGDMLFKCKDWNFTTQTCYGNWTKVMDLVPGREYTIQLSPEDPGFGELSLNTYYMFNTADPQYPAYRRLLNQTVGGTQYASTAMDLSAVGVKCWPSQWIANNWTEQTQVNGTWNFTIYGSCTSKSPQGYLFARLIKQNSTGAYNFQNTTQSPVILCDQLVADAITTSTISYILPSSSYTQLATGERIGVSYCLNQTVKANNQNAYLYWEGGTPSNVKIPTAFYDAAAPVVSPVSPANLTSTFETNITFSYTVTDQNPISSCSLILNGTVNQTNYSVVRGQTQNFTAILSPAFYQWNVNCTDIAVNTGTSPIRTLTIAYKADATPPTWSNNKTYPPTPATYSLYQPYQFNVTWTDASTITEVKIEHNFTGAPANYTVSTSSGNEYYYNYPSLAAGAYYWKEYAQDNYTNKNTTPTWEYLVNKAMSSVNLLLNGTDNNYTILQGQYVNITGYRVAGEGNISIYRNLTLLARGPGPLTNVTRFIPVGSYNFTVTYNSTKNYTASTETHHVTVQADNTRPNITNVTASPPVVGYGQLVNITAKATDNVYIENITAMVIYPNSTSYYYTMLPVGSGVYSYPLTTHVSMPLGQYNVTIISYDPAGNVNNTEKNSFSTYDSPPVFNFHNATPDPVAVNHTVKIYANITDNDGVDTVTVFVNGSNHTAVRNITSVQKVIPITDSTGDCVFAHSSTALQANTSDDYRSLIETGDTCGWNLSDVYDPAFIGFNNITVYVEHVAETGVTPLSTSLYAGNSTSATAYGSTTLSTFEGNQNQLEEQQGILVTGESTDNYVLPTLPTTLNQLNNMQLRVYNGDAGGSDHRGIDRIYLVANYNITSDVFYFSINATWYPMGINNYTIYANDTIGQSSHVNGTFKVDYQIPPVVNITSPATGSTYKQGYDINFTGQAWDFEDGNITGTSLVWSSSIDGVLGTGGKISYATLSPGTHTIYLTATDSFGLSESDSVNVTITTEDCPGMEAGKFTLINITVDGNDTDWDPVLADPDNQIYDGVSGVDDLDTTQSADKDLRRYAVTWNDEWLWMYVRRSSGGANVIGITTYFDNDQNQLLQTTDKVLVADWAGSSGLYDTALFNYLPFNVSGDPITGDGITEPGTVVNETPLESKIPGGTHPGIVLEYRVRWSDLGMPACTPIVAHVSSVRGSGKSVPQSVEDNMARFDTRIFGVKFYSDSIKSGKQGTTVTHTHTLRNIGNLPDLFNLNVTGTNPGYNYTVSYANGTALTDTDGDGRIDTGYILPSYGVTLHFLISIPLTAVSGDIDTTTISAYSKISNITNASVVDKTIVGAIAVIPNNEGLATSNTTATYTHTVYNNDVDSVVNVKANSNQGYNVTLHYSNGTQLTDTNFDSIPDVGLLQGGHSIPLTVKVYVPSGAIVGLVDNTTIIANSTFGESGKAYDKTTVSYPLSIIPNITRAAGQGTSIFLVHNVTYVSNQPGVVDLTYNQTQGFTIQLLKSDYITPLTDTNGNGIIDTGTMGTNGDTKTIVAKLQIPSTAPVNTTDIILYNASTNTTPYIATARDNVSVQKLVSYQDSNFQLQQSQFKQTQTVYAQAYALDMANVYFQYIDPNATVRRLSPYIPVDTMRQADDTYYLNVSDLSGTWQLVLYNKQGSEEITRINYWVNTPPVVLAVNDTPDPIYQGDAVNFTANITAGETRWFPNETVVKGALLEIAGKNYSMTGPNTTTGIGSYRFTGLNTSNITPGTYIYKVWAYDNFTFYNVSVPGISTLTIKFYNITNVSGYITDSRYNLVPSSIYVYNSTGQVVWTDDEIYSFVLDRAEVYNVTVIPDTGNINELTYTGVTWPSQIINFTRLEDSLENETDKPDEIYNWTEAISWWASPSFYFTTVKVNFSYGAETDLVFWKCTDWNFDARSCNNNNFVVAQDLPDGPNSAVVYLTANDPGAGAGRAPDYNETLRVWDVTGLNDIDRRYNGTLVGIFYDLENVNVTIGKSYRFEVFVTQTVDKAIGILRDPYYDNIPDDWNIDTNGTDYPNITQINGSVVIDPFVATIVTGTEPNTQKLIWDSAPPNKTVSDINANDTVKLWFVVDIPTNVSNATHEGHFEGKSKGQDAVISNNLTIIFGSPPYPPNLTFPNNGNDTLINRTITFIWEPAYDPDNQTLTYSINITSEFCSDIYDTNITLTNYTPIYELGTYDECGWYNWTVRAYDGYFYGNWSESWNFSIQPYVALFLVNNTVDFGQADNDQTNDTTDDNPLPFIIQSDGNVFTDILNVTANQSFFTSTLTTDSDFQLKADNSTEIGAFNWTGSATNWINLTTLQMIIHRIDWHDNNDSAVIDVKVHVPIDEPPGLKITGLVFYGEQS